MEKMVLEIRLTINIQYGVEGQSHPELGNENFAKFG